MQTDGDSTDDYGWITDATELTGFDTDDTFEESGQLRRTKSCANPRYEPDSDEVTAPEAIKVTVTSAPESQTTSQTQFASTHSVPPSEAGSMSSYSEIDDPHADPVYEAIERLRSATPVDDPERWTRITPHEREDIERGVMTEQVLLLRRLTRMTASTAPLLRALIHTLEALVRAQEQTQKEVCECLQAVADASRVRP